MERQLPCAQKKQCPLSSLKQCLFSRDQAQQIRQKYEEKITNLRHKLTEMKAKQKDAAQNLA